MGITLNKETYEKLIKADIEEIEKHMPEYSLEKKHAISVLKDSIDFYYKPREGETIKDESVLNIPDVVQQSEQFKAIVFKMANMLALAGKGDEAVQMHEIHNSL